VITEHLKYILKEKKFMKLYYYKFLNFTVGPENPNGQLHVYVPAPLTHCPLFIHGFVLQLLIITSHLSPVHPEVQPHIPVEEEHTPPFIHENAPPAKHP
jgi:hypothetical protein